jgi:pyruvate dehydrogenase E2 component (dihydrolipoamide acetyltransferase)
VASKLVMPEMGPDVTEATVSRWLKKEGEQVRRGEPIVEVMTDKVSRELEAPADGVLTRIQVAEGTMARIDAVLAVIGTAAESSDQASGTTTGGSPAVQTAESAEAPATSGARADTESGGPPRPDLTAEAVEPMSEGRIFSSPAARRLAQELSVDLNRVRGTGPGGRIVERDVQKAAEAVTAPVQAAEPAPVRAPEPAVTPAVRVAPAATPGQTIPLTGLRKIIAERMVQSQHQAAHVTITAEIDMSEAGKLRQQLIGEWEQAHGLRVSYTDLIVRACAKALREHPRVNSSLTGNEMRIHENVHIGVAVALDDGLIVPNIKHADQKSLLELGQISRDLGQRARANKLALDEITGGTFTVTNLGMFGVDAFTPIPNPPESAILGVGKIVEKPVARDGQVVIRPLMWLSLTFDHRIIDGAPAAQFLARVRDILEKPYLLFV